MKTNKLFKTVLLLVALFGGASASWADPVTLASWSSETTTKYTDNGSGYYTPSDGTRSALQVAYSSRIYLYPSTFVGTQSNYKLSFYSSNTSKQCGFYGTGEDKFWMQLSDNSITNYLDGSQHDNYVEVTFPATGYKNVTFHAQATGFSNSSGKYHIVVSPDGGTTWFYGGEYTSTNHYNALGDDVNLNLAVANCSNVIVRMIVGNDKINRSDWRVKNVSITGEAKGETTIRTISTTSNNASYGYVKVNPVGNSFEDGATITAQAIPMDNCSFAYWIDNNSKKKTDNPSTFTASEGLTSITATLKTATTLSSFTFATTDYKNASSKKMDYPADSYTAGHQGVFNVYAPNKTDGTVEKVEWKDIDATNKQIIGTTTSLNLNGVRRAYKYWSDANFTTPCYAQIEISTTGYANIQIKSYLESWSTKAYKTQKLQYSTNGTDFVDLASVDLEETQRWHPLNGGGQSAMANQSKLYIRWTYDMTGEKMEDFVNASTNDSEDLRIGGIVITGDPLVALNENNNYSPVAEANVNVNLTRSLPADKWATIVLPFDMTSDQITSAFGANAKVAQLTGFSPDKLQFTSVTSMNAHEPYLIQVASGDSYSGTATINGVTITTGTPSKTSVSGVDFIGSYNASTDIPYSDASYAYYFISSNTLYQTGTSGTHDTMKGFRAYFKVPDTTAARALSFSIDDEGGETTSIAEVRGKMSDDRGEYFDLQGRKVAQPGKGLYIVNGKKVIIK